VAGRVEGPGEHLLVDVRRMTDSANVDVSENTDASLAGTAAPGSARDSQILRAMHQ
jgi:hypothetical protein